MGKKQYSSHEEDSLIAAEPSVARRRRKNRGLTPTQVHLLRSFAFNNSEAYAREVQDVLTKHFQEKLDEEADRLWDAGILNQQRLDEIRHADLHVK